MSAKAIRYRRMSPRVMPEEDVSSESIPERQLSMWGMVVTLHSGAVSTDFPTLRDAIIAWNRLRPEQAQRASEIPKLAHIVKS